MNPQELTLVKSIEMVKDGASFMRLYWFNHNTGVTMVSDSPIMVGTNVPEEDMIDEMPKEEIDNPNEQTILEGVE